MRSVRLVALAMAVAGFSPFQAEERNVREGNERVAAGDAAGALPHYSAAEAAVGSRPEIDYDRGVALFRQGRADEARDAWRQALQRGAGPLSSRSSQNIGNALAALGDREGAKQAFVEALRQDPRNEDARFNLEVLLRKEQEERRNEERKERRQQDQQQEQDQQQQSAQQRPPEKDGERDAGRSGSQPAPQPQPQPGDAPPPTAERGQDSRENEQRQDGAERPGEETPPERADGGGTPGDRMSREQAERILDAIRSRERVLPLAGTKRRSSLWRPHADRDW